MSLITLLTDFGTEDEYVGVMKGVILSINPSAVIIDITHHIAAQDIVQAAYILKAAYPYFPEGTIHVVISDPGVGTPRMILAAEISDYIFLAPDNGVLSLISDHARKIIRVENARYFLPSVSRTFHGRDIFAPIAAHLSKGLMIESLGTAISSEDIKRLDIPLPQVSEKGISGKIIMADRFGNLMSNIGAEDLKYLGNQCLEIQFQHRTIIGLSDSYSAVKPGEALAIIGSRGYVEIAVNCGNAAEYFNARKGESVRIIRRPPSAR